jgi:8-oxo-dGTP diphosphatase
MPNIKLFNMCMIYDKISNKVLVQDKVNSDWTGITFPGGHIENAESVIESTIREVKEETGLDVANLKFAGLIDWYNTDNHERWFVFLFKTSDYFGEMVSETYEGKVFWEDISKLETMNLAPNMHDYLKLFFNDNLNEAYATWDINSSSDFKLI